MGDVIKADLSSLLVRSAAAKAFFIRLGTSRDFPLFTAGDCIILGNWGVGWCSHKPRRRGVSRAFPLLVFEGSLFR
jgi:hypothetical protein